MPPHTQGIPPRFKTNIGTFRASTSGLIPGAAHLQHLTWRPSSAFPALPDGATRTMTQQSANVVLEDPPQRGKSHCWVLAAATRLLTPARARLESAACSGRASEPSAVRSALPLGPLREERVKIAGQESPHPTQLPPPPGSTSWRSLAVRAVGSLTSATFFR